MFSSFISNELKKRNLPDILTFGSGGKLTSPDQWEQRRSEIIDILCREEYGFAPQDPFTVTSEIVSYNERDYGGKASATHIKIKVETTEGIFVFPIKQFIPLNVSSKPPVIVHIAFNSEVPDNGMSVEEIIDNGFSLVMFNYNDITQDKADDFRSGIAVFFSRRKYSWGKISMWAWAASRVMDYLETVTSIDTANAAVTGHSRLGKTVLWCGATDTRFKYVLPNNSGCSGDSITRDKDGERVTHITKNFAYWFCDKYPQYTDKEYEMPFDQHFLIAAIAPRYVCGGGAIEDTWADPYSQYLAYCAASEAYEFLGLKGFIADDKFPDTGDVYHEGHLGYHLRSGTHYFSRYDWNRYMDFIKSKL